LRTDGFLNVDLEIGARTRALLGPVIQGLHGTLFELFRGRLGRLYRVHYEISGCADDASATIHALADTLDGLDAAARHAWTAAALRDFNVGVELERGVRSIELPLDPDAIRRVSAHGGRIVFTAYQVAAIKRAPRKRSA